MFSNSSTIPTWFWLRKKSLGKNSIFFAFDNLALTSGTSSAERFDADPDQSYEDWKEMTAMTHERYGLAAVEMNGKIYAIGEVFSSKK